MTSVGSIGLAVRPYHAPMLIGGSRVSFDHLEPRILEVRPDKIAHALQIDVKFSNHCFTEGFRDSDHSEELSIMDGIRKRAFCPDRYALSVRLPDMVDGLSLQAVRMTKRERNFTYYTALEDGADFYPMFFHLRKKGDNGEHLQMFVESAYRLSKARMEEQIRASQKVAFPVLCAKIFRGEPLRFNHGR